MWDYTNKVMDHFRNPRNVGTIENPDGVGDVGSLACGDALRLMFKLDEEKKIADAKFQTFGCASAIASSSALTEMIKGMTIEEAENVTNQHIADYLGGLPDQKMHCSVMGKEALEVAIENYRTGKCSKVILEGEVICKCFGVTRKEIEHVIKENDLSEVDEVTNYCKAGGGCGGCKPDIAEIITEVRAEMKPEAQNTPQRKMTIVEKVRLIEETIEREIRPALQKDGGDLDFVDLAGNKVIVSFRGMCAQCKSAQFTMKEVVEAKLREFVSSDIIVEEEKI
jgi:NifU-like protein